MPPIPERREKIVEDRKKLRRALWNLLIKLGYVGNDEEEPEMEELIEQANRFDPREMDNIGYFRRKMMMGIDDDEIPF